MKVYFNRQPVVGPWGGGNVLLSELVNTLSSRGCEVTYDLNQTVDVYFCFDPRPNASGVLGRDIVEVARRRGGVLFCRIGDVGTHGKPELPELWSSVVEHADVVVFPSMFAKHHLAMTTGMSFDGTHVIRNGARRAFFNVTASGRIMNRPRRLVSHHWSDNAAKGFDVYAEISRLEALFRFTYIGRAPQVMKFKHHIGPLTIEGLTAELPKHDLYVTASKAEAGANHVLEAMACGLPVVYHEQGGSIVEYCQHAGEPFDGSITSFLEAVEKCNDRQGDPADSINHVASQVDPVDVVVDRYIDIMFEYV